MKIENILFTGRLYKELEELLANKISQQAVFLPDNSVMPEHLQWADAYVGFNPTQNFNFGSLKWVHSLGAGVDSFLLNREWKKDVLLTRTSASFGQKISEYCISYMLMLAQQHEAFRRNKVLKLWERIEPIPLSEMKTAIFGTGSIGQEIARKLALFGAASVGISLSGKPKPYFQQIVDINSADEILPQMDFIISTLPLTRKTSGIFDAKMFGKMKNACFINVGRGAAVNQEALIIALETGCLHTAVLDVFNEEPLPAGSILWNMPGIRITPHIAAVTTPEEAAKDFLSTLYAIEQKKYPLQNQVDIARGY